MLTSEILSIAQELMNVTKKVWNPSIDGNLKKKFGYYIMMLFEIKKKIVNYNLLTYLIKYELNEKKIKKN